MSDKKPSLSLVEATAEMSQVDDSPTLDEAQVAAFLSQARDFFTRHDELIEELVIPHDSGGAASLLERQLDLLRQRKSALEQQIHTLVGIARDNERLSRHVHALSVDLIQAESLDDLVATVRHHLIEKLAIDDFSLFIIDSQQPDYDDELHHASSVRVLAPDAADIALFRHFMQDRQPVCGQVTPEHVEFLFHDKAKLLRSVAVVPLVHGREYGMLVLGSFDPKRFTADKGGHFLAQLAELLCASLHRSLSVGR